MSHLAWGAWIEIDKIIYQLAEGVSHLAWGAWIEISGIVAEFADGISRTSHGVRGLKFLSDSDVPDLISSHLAWGAWIEIYRLPM